LKLLKISLLLLVPLLLLASFVVLATGAASYRVYVIHTGSMGPNIPSGSAVLVHEGHYHVGQVITFTEDGLTVTHRLVSVNASGMITTKGDGNATNDPWHVPKSQIIGGVVVAPRYVGYWIRYLNNPLGLASVLLAALALWQIWALTSREDPHAKARRRPAHGRSRRPLVPALTFRRRVPNLAMAAEGSGAEVEQQARSNDGEARGAVKRADPAREVEVR
jgi:signal peptidase I